MRQNGSLAVPHEELEHELQHEHDPQGLQAPHAVVARHERRSPSTRFWTGSAGGEPRPTPSASAA